MDQRSCRPDGRAGFVSLGYDRDFATIDAEGALTALPRRAAPGSSSVYLQDRLVRLPAGVMLDLGATAKGLGSDRAAAAAFGATGRSGGILVSLGGDIAVAGRCPEGGWPVQVAEDPIPHEGSRTQVVRLTGGTLATSSVGCRRWRRGDQELHHIIDPRTGSPANGPWRTASVGASTCVAADAVSTALIVGGKAVERWITDIGLPARLIGHDDSVRLVGSWPAEDGAALPIPQGDVLGSFIRAARSKP